ncbi:MAG: helix-turn-helix transcriptional regulator [Candidatus Aenigmarchaeota archaeon]|nr:helix-turn-helix transcriptional regulator [Candidatus Aenigmarchaeota archaeon]
MLTPDIRRILWLYVGGTRGGIARLRILLLLKERPRNLNQLSRALGMDYTTMMYHARVLEKSGLVAPERKRYGSVYFLSPLLDANRSVLDEIAAMLDKAFKSRGSE